MEHDLGLVNAIVMAGRANDARLKDSSPEPWEGLIDIGGKPMVAWVLDALLGCPQVGQIAMVAPKAPFSAFGGDRVTLVEPPGPMIENALAGIRACPPSEFILASTSDIPFVNSSIVERFLKQCSQREGDFYYPVASKESTEKRFPGVKRTYVTIREGTFTGGNMFLVRRSKSEIIAEKARKWVEYRKAPVKQAGLLGWMFVVKMVLGALTIPELEKSISSYLGCRGIAVISNDPEIGTDVDKPSDLELARREIVRPS
jgi:GTP:adenosylcobinamide-phosphate guanylyltransferase